MVKVITSNRASRRLSSSGPAQRDRLRFCSSTFFSLLSASFLFSSLPSFYHVLPCNCTVRSPSLFPSSASSLCQFRRAVNKPVFLSFFLSELKFSTLSVASLLCRHRSMKSDTSLFFPPLLPFFSTLNPLEFSTSLHPSALCLCVYVYAHDCLQHL